MDPAQRIPPDMEPDTLSEGLEGRHFDRRGFQRADRMDSLQTAKVDHQPEHIGLPHQECSNPEQDDQHVASKAGPGLHAEQMVCVGVYDREGGRQIGVVESGEEEEKREEADIDGAEVGVERPPGQAKAVVASLGRLHRTEGGDGDELERGQDDEGIEAADVGDGAGTAHRPVEDDREEVEARRGGDLVIPLPEAAVAVLLGLRDVEELVLAWESTRRRSLKQTLGRGVDERWRSGE